MTNFMLVILMLLVNIVLCKMRVHFKDDFTRFRKTMICISYEFQTGCKIHISSKASSNRSLLVTLCFINNFHYVLK